MKKKRHTIDAQEMKRALHRTADKLGRRKRITAGQFFNLLCDVMAEART